MNELTKVFHHTEKSVEPDKKSERIASRRLISIYHFSVDLAQIGEKKYAQSSILKRRCYSKQLHKKLDSQEEARGHSPFLLLSNHPSQIEYTIFCLQTRGPLSERYANCPSTSAPLLPRRYYRFVPSCCTSSTLLVHRLVRRRLSRRCHGPSLYVVALPWRCPRAALSRPPSLTLLTHRWARRRVSKCSANGRGAFAVAFPCQRPIAIRSGLTSPIIACHPARRRLR